MKVKQRVIVYLALMLMNLIGLAVAMKVDDRIAWVSIAAIVLFAFLLSRTRCPRCGTNVFRRSRVIGGIRWTYGQGWPLPSRCPKCQLSFVDSDPE